MQHAECGVHPHHQQQVLLTALSDTQEYADFVHLPSLTPSQYTERLTVTVQNAACLYSGVGVGPHHAPCSEPLWLNNLPGQAYAVNVNQTGLDANQHDRSALYSAYIAHHGNALHLGSGTQPCPHA